jgi:hypothetical protein
MPMLDFESGHPVHNTISDLIFSNKINIELI